MAVDDIEPSRKRKKLSPIQKLTPHQKVEIRSLEDGFEGSWHSATVIDVKNQNLVVKFDHILCDDGSDNMVESIPVFVRNHERIRIRPVPPRFKDNIRCLHYGQCVDVFHQDAWWEGVIFDYNDLSEERYVFFPDIGDELRASINDIRLTRDWNVVTEEWNLCGDWVFLEVLEELELESPVLVSVKQIWYELRMKKRFEKDIKEWTFKVRDIWKETIKEVILDNLKLTMVHFFGSLQGKSVQNQNLDINKQFVDSIVKVKASFFDSLAVLPVDSNILPIEDNADTDDDDVGPPGFSKREIISTRIYDPSNNWTKVNESCMVEHDLAIQPKCCPDSIFQYYEYKNNDSRPPQALAVKVRQHLLYLGWKVEFKKDNNGSRTCQNVRYRYTSPNKKLYFSLNVLCADICNRSSEFASLESHKRAQLSMEVDSEYCPQAVVDYYSTTLDENHDWQQRRDVESMNLCDRAKKHLRAVGWLMSYADVMCRRPLYTSPNGKKFQSFRQACIYYIQNSSISDVNMEKSEGGESKKEKAVGKLIIKKKDGRFSIKAAAKRKESLFNVKLDEETESSSRKKHVLRSCKRVREENSPMQQTPRTVLSWLVDNNVIVPRSKVFYRCKKDGHTMKEGRVNRDGIKCSCCQMLFSVSKFEIHAGSSNKRPSANIFLEDGRSLLDCQLQLKSDQSAKLFKKEPRKIKGNRQKIINDNDYICSVCHYGGELVLCDQCPSSFHTRCLGLEEVPDGDWFCPSCCCRICNQNKYSDECEQDTDNKILNCEQCERRYHIGCVKRKEGFLKLASYPQVNWFCSLRCEEIHSGLNNLLGKPIPVGRDDLTWTILKHKRPDDVDHDITTIQEMAESYSKLNIAISVMHECFEPVKEPRTQRDIVEDVIFCRWSELNRLNFKGFYTVLLEKEDELISAASIRIYGEKVAELPLIGTRFRYRRSGMCHALMSVLEKKLVELGIERLVLPAVPSVLKTWTSSFGFSVMTESQKLDFLGYTFLDFQGTHMCQKYLNYGDQPSAESRDAIIAVSEVSQVEKIKESGIMVDQHSLSITQDDQTINGTGSASLEILANDQPSHPHVQCQSQTSAECSIIESSNINENDNNRNNGHVLLKCYHRRKMVACGS
ncbi:uncharacterized protein [Rutidosis leptorrhynchoides]|uniref:uncharacterized protein isoform X2 n=1 Tax=Rutidosis leptorrhynchoides TaxID=125765 RepID=UPI003A98EF82